MSGVPAPVHRATTRFVRLAAVLALLAQAVATLVAPIAEARAQHSTPAHVEAGGTSRHWAHDPTDCAACLALRMVGAPSVPADPAPPGAERATQRPAEPQGIAHDGGATQQFSRAPPIASLGR